MNQIALPAHPDEVRGESILEHEEHSRVAACSLKLASYSAGWVFEPNTAPIRALPCCMGF